MNIAHRLVQVIVAAALTTSAMFAGSGAGQPVAPQRIESAADSPRSMADHRVALAHTVSWAQVFTAGNW